MDPETKQRLKEPTMNEILLLLLRDAIADKEWSIACANMETAAYGKWSCDWNQGMREAQDKIDKILKRIDPMFQPGE